MLYFVVYLVYQATNIYILESLVHEDPSKKDKERIVTGKRPCWADNNEYYHYYSVSYAAYIAAQLVAILYIIADLQ